jgi:hypothetical protein
MQLLDSVCTTAQCLRREAAEVPQAPMTRHRVHLTAGQAQAMHNCEPSGGGTGRGHMHGPRAAFCNV